MASLAQIAANRRNALKSTGPRTAAGKQRSARNACRHGLRSQTLFLPGEDPRQFEQLLADFRGEHRPSTPGEHLCVLEMTVAMWKILRADRAENSLLEAGTLAGIPELSRIIIARSEFLHRFLSALNRLLEHQARPRLPANSAVPREQKISAIEPNSPPNHTSFASIHVHSRRVIDWPVTSHNLHPKIHLSFPVNYRDFRGPPARSSQAHPLY